MAELKPVNAEDQAIVAAPFGTVVIRAHESVLTDIELLPDALSSIESRNPLLRAAVRQLQAYFRDPRCEFELPLALYGTPYRLQVWAALRGIVPGTVKTYGQLARDLRSGPRAIAGACRNNEFPIIIPCHRVVSSQGLGGYCGWLDGPYLDIKRWLLRHEGYESA